MAAALLRCQLPKLQARNAAGAKQVRSLNQRLLQLPGLLEQTYNRADMQRLHYSWNMLFIDEKKAGISRAAAVKALQAEGVRTSNFGYTLQHKLPLYSEAKWWHHSPGQLLHGPARGAGARRFLRFQIRLHEHHRGG